MLTNVVRQMVLARKRLGAVLTAVRRLSRVRPDVNHQVLLPGERLAAPRLPSVQRKASLTRQHAKNPWPSLTKQLGSHQQDFKTTTQLTPVSFFQERNPFATFRIIGPHLSPPNTIDGISEDSFQSTSGKLVSAHAPLPQ